MRIQRIALKDFRGVGSADIAIAETGVTIVEGPNEIGKSSLAEALYLLFDELDSSGKERVKALKPVSADAGPWALVELTTGPYALVYEKRWLKNRETALRVTAPAPESLTGREAHERMQAILGETLDIDLFKALRYEQGKDIAQATVGGSPSLLRALDAAAGGTAGADDDGGLLARVDELRLRYFTPTGKPLQPRVADAARVVELATERAELEAKLRALEAAAERHRAIGLELARISAEEPAQALRVATQRAASERVTQLQQEVAKHDLAVVAADGKVREAAAAVAARTRLVEALAAADARLAACREQAEREAPGLSLARQGRSAAAAAHDAAKELLEHAEQASRRASEDAAHFDDAYQVGLLEERHTRAVAADAANREASAILDANTVTDGLLKAIGDTAVEVAVLRARAEESRASVTVEALAPVRVTVDAHEAQVAAGQTLERAVAGDVVVTIADVARITVAGPTAGKELAEQSAQATAKLARLLAEAGVNPALPDAHPRAEALARQRREAQGALELASVAFIDALRDLTLASLAEKVIRGRQRIEGYRAARPPDSPLAVDGDAARAAAELARNAADEARRNEGIARAALDDADTRARDSHQVAQRREAEIDEIGRSATGVRAELAAARESAPDLELVGALAAAQATAAAVASTRAAAVAELAATDPATTTELLRNAEDVLDRLRRDRGDLTIELEGIRRELAVRGQDGLADRLGAVDTLLLALERKVADEDRRAAAVELLHARLTYHRAEALRSYVTPYRDKLESYARLVFGSTASVTVDEKTLQIVSRTLDGETVPYESLSGGAKEQLCVVARLACAAMVAGSESGAPGTGVPVIFDDALGYSDVGRLERLGAAFRRAGESCQVIILTCLPERYANVGSATRVPFG